MKTVIPIPSFVNTVYFLLLARNARSLLRHVKTSFHYRHFQHCLLHTGLLYSFLKLTVRVLTMLIVDERRTLARNKV